MENEKRMNRLDRFIGLGMSCVMALAIAMAYMVPARAQWTSLPTGGQGQLPPNDAPCRTYTVDQTTGTAEALVSSVPMYVNWLMLSTATADASRYVTLKDTSTSSNNQEDLMRLYHASTVQNTYISFQPPFSLQRGLTVTKANSADWVTVCGRPINSQFP